MRKFLGIRSRGGRRRGPCLLKFIVWLSCLLGRGFLNAVFSRVLRLERRAAVDTRDNEPDRRSSLLLVFSQATHFSAGGAREMHAEFLSKTLLGPRGTRPARRMPRRGVAARLASSMATAGPYGSLRADAVALRRAGGRSRINVDRKPAVGPQSTLCFTAAITRRWFQCCYSRAGTS